MSKIQALVVCQNEDCAAEVSYHLDMVRKLGGQPICQLCYEDGDYCERDDQGVLTGRWDDLPPVTLTDLSP